MGLEKKLFRLDKKIEQVKEIRVNSLKNALVKAWDFGYVLRVGGALMRRYQKPLSERLGWKEKDLTIRSAVYMSILPALVYATLNQNFGDNISESFQKNFYLLPTWSIFQALFRITYSQITKRAIGSISIENLIGSSTYFMNDYLEKEEA
jgi:hypothetical protein